MEAQPSPGNCREKTHVILKVYDFMGKRSDPWEIGMAPGEHHVSFDASGIIGRGFTFIRFKQMVLLNQRKWWWPIIRMLTLKLIYEKKHFTFYCIDRFQL